MGNQEAELQQRVLGYTCTFTRTVDEATASLFHAITSESGVVSGGAVLWLGRIEEWLGGSEHSMGGLNFSGARFTDAEWRMILGGVAARLRRHLTRG